ncbi:hypothetical protein AAFF27_13665 [Xylophilus sp. GW821-FHT01B05]
MSSHPLPLQKSDKARQELASGQRSLGLKERACLLMADGLRTQQQLLALVPGDAALIDRLLADGYLLAAQAASPPPAIVVPQAADDFGGKRSLATTRMFLFDICERMFVRRLPDKAEHYREALRQARDRDTMLAVAREIVADVEALAGTERADGLSERIAMLLPPA